MKNLIDLAAEIINSSKAHNWPAGNKEWGASVAEFNQRYAQSKITAVQTMKAATTTTKPTAAPRYSATVEFKSSGEDD